MKEEVSYKNSRLANGMLHIHFEDGHSWLYSLEEVVDYIVTAQQSLALDRFQREQAEEKSLQALQRAKLQAAISSGK
jgi:hypothetical protein